MNRKADWVRVSWMAGALLPLVAGIAGAANINSTQPQTKQCNRQKQQVACAPGQTARVQPKLERAKNLLGAEIVNEKGERLGTVADIVLTSNRDAVSYAVLSHGETWGVGDKYFAVPWSQFSFRPGERAGQEILALKNVTKANLDKAPGFDKNHWPMVAEENWLGIERGMRAETGYGVVKSGDIEHLRLSRLMGISVRNRQDENLGRLDNVVIDVHQGKLGYGIVAIRNGFLGLNKDFVAVPWPALDLSSQPGIAKLDAGKETLMAIAFDKKSFPNLEDPQYSHQLYERFHAMPYGEGQNLGFVPGEENRSINPPSSSEMKAPHSEMTAPNVAPNPAAKEGMTTHHMGKHALSYNPNAVETIHGTVKSVGTYRIERTSVRGVLLNVRTDDGRILRVQAGPRPFLDGQKISFRAGEPVTITGSMVKAGRHDIVLTSQIKTADRTLDLRAPDGKPLWNLDQYRSSPSASAGFGDPNPYDW